jgi:hypothetical protein
MDTLKEKPKGERYFNLSISTKPALNYLLLRYMLTGLERKI